jgi:hypothetical protein
LRPTFVLAPPLPYLFSRNLIPLSTESRSSVRWQWCASGLRFPGQKMDSERRWWVVSVLGRVGLVLVRGIHDRRPVVDESRRRMEYSDRKFIFPCFSGSHAIQAPRSLARCRPLSAPRAQAARCAMHRRRLYPYNTQDTSIKQPYVPRLKVCICRDTYLCLLKYLPCMHNPY